MKRFPMFLCSLLLLLAACGGKKTLKKVGEFCSGDGDCVSGLCFESVCLDPDTDDDGDGLMNGLEVRQLGTNPTKSDTDDDGTGDFQEVGNISAPYDKDGDGLIDAIESRMADADKDCIPDEYDPQNEVPDENAEQEIAKIHCTKQGGVCIEFLEHIQASCVEGVPQCEYGEVFGYEETESLCDGKDNDCDGETDEGLVSLTEGECSTQGVCAGVQIERICLNGVWVCKYEAIPDWEASETRLDGLDNDCNGQTDEHAVGEPCKRENEYGSCAGTYVLYENRAMCNSPEPAPEQCDGKDNDCNGETDEEGADGCLAYYADRDTDEFGSSESRCLCAPQEPYTAKIAGDCNDNDPSVNPDATEKCNGKDDDCNNKVDDFLLVLTRDASTLDAEETKVTTFLESIGLTYDIADAGSIASGKIGLSKYRVLYFRTEAEPTAYNSSDVLEPIRNAVEGGCSLIVEYHGGYLAKYLGWGEVQTGGWFPVVLDKVAFVKPITEHQIFDGVPTWDPPDPPDRPEQYIDSLISTGAYSGDVPRLLDSQRIACWTLYISYGWPYQPTNSLYCQVWGGCTPERSVHELDLIEFGVQGAGMVIVAIFFHWSTSNAPLTHGEVLNILFKNVIYWACGQ